VKKEVNEAGTGVLRGEDGIGGVVVEPCHTGIRQSWACVKDVGV
jgi:hypothetical protein